VRKWEYKKFALNEAQRRSDDIDLLCEAGEEGWELVAVLPNGIAYLKREAEDCFAEPERTTVREEPGQARAAGVENAALNGAAVSLVKAKYRDPETGETWSGRGRMASWLKRKQDAGEDIENYLV
jgi:H-NS histone family